MLHFTGYLLFDTADIEKSLNCLKNGKACGPGGLTKENVIQGGPKKSKPAPIFQKIALKIANEIRFLRKVKV